MPAPESLSRNILVAVFAICTLVCSAWAKSTTPEVQENNPGTTTQAPSQNSEPGQAAPEPPPETKEQTPETKDQTPTKRAPSADAKQEAWKILDDAASGDKAEQRAAAIRALGLLPKNVRAVTMAEKALKDAKTEVRTAAALALGEMHAKQSIPVLKAALGDPEPSVALAAGQALSQFPDPDAYSIFYEVLTGERKTGKGLIASQEAILKDPKKLATLGIAQGVGFIPFGGFGWEAFKMLSKDDVSPVRASSARMLAYDPDPASIKALQNATSDKSWLVRTAALEALAKRGDPTAMDTVELSMYDDKDVVQYTAASAFLRLSELKEGRVTLKRNAPNRSKPRHNKK